MKKMIVVACALALACQQTKEMPTTTTTTTATTTASTEQQLSIPASHSWSKPEEAAVEHLTLDLGVDFTKKQLAGTATLRIKNSGSANKLVLDTRDLTITDRKSVV